MIFAHLYPLKEKIILQDLRYKFDFNKYYICNSLASGFYIKVARLMLRDCEKCRFEIAAVLPLLMKDIVLLQIKFGQLLSKCVSDIYIYFMREV